MFTQKLNVTLFTICLVNEPIADGQCAYAINRIETVSSTSKLFIDIVGC